MLLLDDELHLDLGADEQQPLQAVDIRALADSERAGLVVGSWVKLEATREAGEVTGRRVTLIGECQGGREIDSRRGLAHSSLLIGDGDYP